MTSETPAAPLEGVRILDLTHMLAGPYATMLLADLGADVVKIEPPHGEFTRSAGPTFGGPDEEFGGYFQSINRNKRSLPIDLRHPEGKALFFELVERADAVIENFRVGIMESLGLGWESLKERNPRLVYGCIRGFGDPRTGESPYVEWPAYDIVAQAMSGFMTVNGFPDREPVKSGLGVGDIFPAALLDVGVLAGILHARATGEGRFVDIGMYDAMISLAERTVYQQSINGVAPTRIGNRHPLFSPFGVFETADGWVTIAAPNNREWRVLAPLMGKPELVDDPRFAELHERGRNVELVHDIVSGWTKSRTKAEIVGMLGGKVPVGPVQTAAELSDDPHLAARDMLLEVEQPGSERPMTIAGSPIKFAPAHEGAVRRAPRLGEHTRAVLADFSVAPERVEALLRDGVLVPHPEPAGDVALGAASA